MVSTREILYVLLITLAASGCVNEENNPTGFSYGAILPLLLLLLLSTDNRFNQFDPCCCNHNNRFLGSGGRFGPFI